MIYKYVIQIFMNFKKVLLIILGVLTVVSGFFCLLNPVLVFLQLGYIVGVFILFDSIGNIIAYFDSRQYMQISGWYLFNAIVSLFFGLLIIISLRMQMAVDVVIAYMASIWLLIAGFTKVSMAIRIKKLQNEIVLFKSNRWVVILISGIFIILFGILCLVKPVVMSSLIGTILSLAIIFVGVNIITFGSYY